MYDRCGKRCARASSGGLNHHGQRARLRRVRRQQRATSTWSRDDVMRENIQLIVEFTIRSGRARLGGDVIS